MSHKDSASLNLTGKKLIAILKPSILKSHENPDLFSDANCTKQSYPGLKSSLVDWIPGNRIQLVLLAVISVKCQCRRENFCRIWKSESSINNRVVSFCTLIDWVVVGRVMDVLRWSSDLGTPECCHGDRLEQVSRFCLWHLLLLRLDCTKRLRDNIINGNAQQRGMRNGAIVPLFAQSVGKFKEKGEDIFHVPLTICIISIAAWDTIL